METINLTDIIDDIFLNCSGDTTKFWAKGLAKQCALEFGKQLLELAAENAETTYTCSCGSTEFNPVSDGWSCRICGKDPLPEIEVDKQSILNTIKQVE